METSRRKKFCLSRRVEQYQYIESELEESTSSEDDIASICKLLHQRALKRSKELEIKEKFRNRFQVNHFSSFYTPSFDEISSSANNIYSNPRSFDTDSSNRKSIKENLGISKQHQILYSDNSKRFSLSYPFSSNITHSKEFKDDNQRPIYSHFNKSEIDSYEPEKRNGSSSTVRKSTGLIPLNSWSKAGHSKKNDWNHSSNLLSNNSNIVSLQPNTTSRFSFSNHLPSKKSTTTSSALSKVDDSKQKDDKFSNRLNLNDSEIRSFEPGKTKRDSLLKSTLLSTLLNESAKTAASDKSNELSKRTRTKSVDKADDLQQLIEKSDEYSINMPNLNSSEIASIGSVENEQNLSTSTKKSNKTSFRKSTANDSLESSIHQPNWNKSAIESAELNCEEQNTSRRTRSSTKSASFKQANEESSINLLNLNKSEIVSFKDDSVHDESTNITPLRRSTRTPSKSQLNTTKASKDEQSKEYSITIPNLDESEIEPNKSRQNYSIRTRSFKASLNNSEIETIEPQTTNRSTIPDKSSKSTGKHASASFNLTKTMEFDDNNEDYSISLPNLNDSEADSIEPDKSNANRSIKTRSLSKASNSREGSIHQPNLNRSEIVSIQPQISEQNKSMISNASSKSIRKDSSMLVDTAVNKRDDSIGDKNEDKEANSMQLLNLSDPNFDSINSSNSERNFLHRSSRFSRISPMSSFNATAASSGNISEEEDEEAYSVSMPNLDESITEATEATDAAEANYSDIIVSFEPSIDNLSANDLENEASSLSDKESRTEASKEEQADNLKKSSKKPKSTGQPITKKQQPKFYETMINKTPTIIYPQVQQHDEEEDDQDSAVRRSNRIRVRPLEYWRNQKLKYKLDTDTKCYTVEGVEKGFKPENPFSKKYVRVKQEPGSNKRKLKQSKRKTKMPKIKEEDENSSDNASESSSEDERREPVKRARYTNDESIHQNINESAFVVSERIKQEAAEFHSKSDLVWMPSKHSQGVFIALMNRKKSVQTGVQASGFMKMEPFAEKPRQTSSDYVTKYVVMFGAVSVQIADKPAVFLKGLDSFIIQKNTAYSVRNLRKDEALMHFDVTRAVS